MKNKLRLIDVSMLSSYMGRALTVFVMLFVIVVAVSAYFNEGGGGFERGVIAICVRAAPAAGDLEEFIEPFRSLLGRETRRPVVSTDCRGEWPAGFDLYVMPVHEYFEFERSMEIQALYEIQSSPRQTDKAVIISRASAADEPAPGPAPSEIVFSHPLSVNGFWVQVAELEANGFEVPDDPRSLEFAGSAVGGDRVIFSVLCGAYPYGACKLSEVVARTREGSVVAGELEVTHVGDALPELVIATRREDTEYYKRNLERIARLLEEVRLPAQEDETVGLLKSRGVRRLLPLTPERIGETRRLYEEYGGVFDSSGE